MVDKNILEMAELSALVYDDDISNPITVNDTIGFHYKVLRLNVGWGDFSQSGFQGMLLEDLNKPGNYVIAFRGTEPGNIIPDDMIGNILSGTANYNPQISQAQNFVEDIIANPPENHIITKSNLTLTGHSLGGILTQAVGANLHIPGYAYNSYGANLLENLPSFVVFQAVVSLLTGPVNGAVLSTALYSAFGKIYELLGAQSADTVWAQDNIVNVSLQDDGFVRGDPLSNLATGL